MASLSCSGGEASLVADLSETTSLTFSPFPDDQRSRIEATLTELVSVANPFDYHTFMWGDRAAMGATFGETMDGPHDATMLVLDAPPGGDQDPSTWITAAEAFADAADRTRRRGVVVATMPECLSPEVRSSISARGIAPLQGLREALVALDRCAWLAAHAPQPRPAAVTAPAANVLVDEQRAKERLGSLGVRVPRGERAGRADVLAVASRVGYPVTLKGLGLAHKSEVGAVALGLRDATALEVALAAMPESLTEFLVEETVTGIVAEVLVTVRRAAPLGWLITIGAGGVLTELWRDTQSLLAPTTTDEIRSAIERLRISAILAGYRGKPAGDVDALVAFVDHLQRVVVGTNAVEVELNPVLVTTSGAIAVDALPIEEA